jgi:polyisoprenoid-binding protein YceI
MKTFILAAATAGLTLATPLLAAENYTLDSSHSQIVFSYDHLGFSTTYGMFAGFEGQIMFDAENPAASSVTVSMPVQSMFTGWEARTTHFMSGEFFDASADELVTFTSTGIEVTGDTTANITGELTLNGVTKSVVLAATLNKAADHPMANKAWLGFNATTTLKRSDYGLGKFAPAIADEVEVMISLEAQKAD